MRPETSPRSTHATSPSQNAAAHTYRALRSSLCASRRKSSALFSSSSASPLNSVRALQRLLSTPGPPPRAMTSSPESSATVGSRDRRWKCRAFASAFSSNVAAFSSTSSSAVSAIPASSRLSTSNPAARNIGRSSRILPVLRVASSREKRIGKRGKLLSIPGCSLFPSPFSLFFAGKRPLLRRIDLPDSAGGEIEQTVEIVARERTVLARALNLDETTLAAHDDVHVDVRGHILDIVEIEARLALDQPHTDRRDAALHGRSGEPARGHHPCKCLHGRHA